MELVVAMAVSLIVSGVAVFAFVMAMETYTRMVRQYEAETEMVSAIMTLRSTLSSAVNVNYCGDNTSGARNADTARTGVARTVTRGCVYRGNFSSGVVDESSAPEDQVRLMAFVLRDMNVDFNRSKMFASAIYYKRPSDNPRASGAIYLDQEVIDPRPNQFTAGWVKLSPVNAPFMYTRITEFEASNPRTFSAGNTSTTTGDVGSPIMSMNYRITMRYFTKGRVQDFRWFPAGNSGTGSGMDPYRQTSGFYYDLTKQFKVNFVNNTFDQSRFMSSRTLGNIYLFKYAAGQSRTR